MNFIYIHVCCINNYKEVFNNLIHCIKDSGLYKNVKEIRCCVLGEYDPAIFSDEKIKIVAENANVFLYEQFTINKLHNDCKTENFNVLYLHTKGVTRPENVAVKSWVDYLCYFNIYNYAKCLELLTENDTVGVNLHDCPQMHYSGNFWWSKSSYINKLNPCIYECYNTPEFWLTCNKNGKYISLWSSGLDHYFKIYQTKEYENKPFNITEFSPHA
jgi:hypothetical protein